MTNSSQAARAEPTSLQLSLRPEWSEFDALREKTAEYLKQQNVEPDTAQALAMVVGELAENAAKYGVFRRSLDNIVVKVTYVAGTITVEVSNPLGPRELEHIARLDRMIQWIRGFQDPFEAYLERLKEVSAQQLTSNESGLGLARIAYEGQSILDFVVKDHNQLSVSAIHRLEEGRF
jgi:hypothetical protein